MSFVELVDNSRTDKNTFHSYLELYETILHNKKYTAKNVLEIGVQTGGSIKLWYDYFTNATIHGLDKMSMDQMWNVIKDKERIKLYTSIDAYDEQWFNTTFLDTNIKFDILLDDGPHSIESLIQFIKLYGQLMTDDGILIIEDLQHYDWVDILTNEVPEGLKQYIKVYDRRHIKNRSDDLVFTIDKSNV